MLFKDYLEQINKYAEEHPETLDLNLLHYRLSYGGGFTDMEISPRVGYFSRHNKDADGYLIPEEEFEHENEFLKEGSCKIDSICLSTYGN